MSEYDFSQLTWPELETLARDLLQAEWRVYLESFKTGKDGGIDYRYAYDKNNVIVQVKHYLRTGYKGLIKELKKEAVKVQSLQPSRYILVTSVPLSCVNKTEIIEIIGAQYLCDNDIIGQDDLNNLLGKHSEIEKQHYKLWLASTAVLQRVLHNAEITNSEFKVYEVHEHSKRYVQSNAYPKALKLLDEQRLVIVAGSPGVGKTTLADLLLYQHLEQGYQAVVIQRDIAEGQKLFQKGVKQIFYFDDFMGTTFLGDQSFAISANADKAILDFIRMVKSNPDSRLVLTTREHIYSQAMDKSERFRHSDLNDYRVVLNMPAYSSEQKARILYNHLYFSDLPYSYQDALLENNFYLQIIKHKKFNPRLIEWLSTFHRVKQYEVENYQEFVINLLNDPSEIWMHAYHQEISDAARSILLTIFSQGGGTTGYRLKAGFEKLHEVRAKKYGFVSRPEDFNSAFKEVAGAFIELKSQIGIEVIDPSVMDLMNRVVREAPANALDIICAATSYDQIYYIWKFSQADKSASVHNKLHANIIDISTAIQERSLDCRKTDHGNGVISYRSNSYESRFNISLKMAKVYDKIDFKPIIQSIFVRMQQEWKSERVVIDDAIAACRSLRQDKVLPEIIMIEYEDIIRNAILDEISTGGTSTDLMETLSLFDTNEMEDLSVKTQFKSAFAIFESKFFDDELNDYNSEDEFDDLIDNLKDIADMLDVSTGALAERVEELKDEYLAESGDYGDYMSDQMKEDHHMEKQNDQQTSELFGSLTRDRN